ncbi:Wall-associated receptor kinase-like 8 [Vitis vinifera]|uniref:Wall-associated receptor kinase-like 8 n=1 Tax=Vitis vinifera TaxID=29760 RepID=A0A438KA48_VITVI|nr:Wall-associated receptor kinase-like 8 [Vitis vinifera]
MIGRLLLQLIIFILCLTRASSAAPSLAQPGCNDACGSVSIPYPFGVGKDCYLNEWFSINCKHSTPFFTHPNLNGSQHTQVLDSVDLEGSPFLFSKKGDAVSVSGCGSVSLLSRQDKYWQVVPPFVTITVHAPVSIVVEPHRHPHSISTIWKPHLIKINED